MNTDQTTTPTESAPAPCSEGDYRDTPEYQEFLVECAKHCRCTHSICDGVLAGGLCDEIIEDDSDKYLEDDDE